MEGVVKGGLFMFKLYKKYLKYYKKEVILGPLFKLLEAVFELLVPLIMASIIDKGVRGEDIQYVLKMGGVLAGAAVIGLCSTLVCQYFACQASQGVGTKLREDLFTHINGLSFKELDYFKISSLMTRMTTDINQVQVSVAMLIRLIVRAPFIVIGATVMAFFVSNQLWVIFMVTGILIFGFIFLIMKINIPKNKLVQQDVDQVTRITKESLSGARVIRAFSKTKYEVERFCHASDDLEKDLIKVGRINALLSPLTTIIVNFAIILLLYFGSFSVDAGTMTQGDITALANYMHQILVAIVVVANLVVIFTKAMASSSRINEVFAMESSIVNGLEKTGSHDEKLCFKDVSFAYNSSANPALEDINFTMTTGQTVGIIGSTGCGKTTLVNLISRFYDPSKGSIMLNGRELNEYDLEYLHDAVTVVLQKSSLLHGTIRDNIIFGRTYTDEEVWKALEDAQAAQFVKKLPKKLDTMVLEGAKNFSGGEKQRLAIARALIRKPEILILDDSFSALDYKTDFELRKTLRQIDKNICIIMISARVASIQNSDKILVLDNAKIIGQGTHQTLMEDCVTYRDIYHSQQGDE